MKFLMKNGKIIDGLGSVIEDGWILVEGDSITGVGSMDQLSKESISPDEEMDLSGMCAMPGIIDGHVHICMDASPNTGKGDPEESDTTLALKTARNAAMTLAAGVTTVRDLGGRNFVNLAVRDAIYSGDIPGPRILSAGQNICMTGGHGWRFGRQADGPDEVRRAVREQARAGADLIKFMSTGGTLTKTGKPGQTQFTEVEIRAGIEEAHKAGLKTSTHAKGIEGTKFAVRSGVDSVEHGAMLDDELIDWIIEKGIFVVPTLVAGANIIKKGSFAGTPEWAVEKAKRYRPVRLESLSKAKAAGVRVAFGTDAGTPFNHHGKNAEELMRIQEIGFSPAEAIIAATSLNAKMIGMDGEIGAISEGLIADIIVVDGDPMADTKVLLDTTNIHTVLQSGKRVAKRGHLII